MEGSVKKVSVHEAKTHLSKLLLLVSSGEEIVITNSGTPVAKLSRVLPSRILGGKGMDSGKVEIASDFDSPLPKKWQKLFE